MNQAWLAALPLAWLLGSIPFSYLLPKWWAGRDVRTEGSGNVGATNAARTAGPWVGGLCVLLDAGKGALPILVLQGFAAPPEMAPMAAACSVLGHGYPPWLKGIGGKGVATTAGAVLALHPWAGGALLGAWLLLLALGRRVSVASVGAAVLLPGLMVLCPLPGSAPLPLGGLAFGVGAASWIVLRHRRNLSRLREGTEPMIGRKSA
ncbi:MAG: glycerol-3-phosphate acyltransferase [Candidatus Sericytochromatia bacterium]|nr:glycerol-3-phosphate acyltransferase [Candidatus Sericytochromatia bacterium]